MKTRRLCQILLVLAFAGWLAGAAPAPPLPLGNPAQEGVSPERLDKLRAMVRQYIADGKYAGVVALIARHGKVVDWRAFGYRDVENQTPMELDTIARVYSMSKVVTSVAVMMLFEEGRFRLDDQITRYIPEFSRPRVFKGGTVENPELVDATRPFTIKELLTHTSGLTYDFGNGPVDQLYKRANLWEATSLPDFIRRLAPLPLVHQPGEAWTYGVNTDVLGYLVEVVSGQKFEDFLQERLFGPLGMKDTGFDVPESKWSRIAKIHEVSPEGRLRVKAPILGVYAEARKGFASGGAGLFSTIGDYARFGQMLLNGGRLDGVQILGKKTVELMMTNHLNHLPRQTHIWSESDGFGLGGSVRIDLAMGNSLGSLGQFGWSGAATTYFSLDPQEETVALLFVQHLPHDQYGIFSKFSTLFYQSLVE